jgi:hypothetical protein
MKIAGSIKINGQSFAKGANVPWYMIYPFFLVHMLMFGGSGFLMAYSDDPAPIGFLYMHGGLAITVYTVFYLAIFGRDEVKWMFINAGLGLLGIYTQIGWLLALFDKDVGDYPFYVHVIPFLYFVLYTFLVRRAVLDIMGVGEDHARQQRVEYTYIFASIAIYIILYLWRG